MAARKDTHQFSVDEWRKLGELVSQTRRNLSYVTDAANHCSAIPAAQMPRLAAVQRHFERVIREIEYHMFRVGGPQDLTIFHTGFGLTPEPETNNDNTLPDRVTYIGRGFGSNLTITGKDGTIEVEDVKEPSPQTPVTETPVTGPRTAVPRATRAQKVEVEDNVIKDSVNADV